MNGKLFTCISMLRCHDLVGYTINLIYINSLNCPNVSVFNSNLFMKITVYFVLIITNNIMYKVCL